MAFYTNFAIREGYAACTRGPVIFIRPEYRGDAGILAHEKLHAWQWWSTLGLHSFLYLLWPAYRLRAEVAAYRVQMACYPDDRAAYFAKMLSERYGLRVTAAEALRLLRGDA